ncbi:MAG: RNA polymerase sigma factor [Myxococcales bacterium]
MTSRGAGRRVLPGVEREWVDGLRRGDPAAFEAVYAAYRPRLYGFLARLCPEEAEELLQETFVKLATHARRLREDTRLTPWLFTVARNLARSQGRWRTLTAAALAALGAAPTPRRQSPFEEAAQGAELRRLERALARLPAAQREALLLVGWEGLSAQEASEILSVKAEALRQRLSRARAALAAILEEDDAR